MPMKITYHKLDSKFLDLVCELDRICFDVNWSRSVFENEISNPKAYYIVALCDGKAVGYCGIDFVVDEGSITNLAVHPDFRNKGIASKLLKLTEEFAFNEKLSFITLEVRESNYNAIKLYEKNGFKEVGRRKNYYSDNRETAILMTKTLKG